MTARLCSIEGCGKLLRARGLCAMHYWRLKSWGFVEDRPASPSQSSDERFWALVEKTETCWLWTGGKTGSGYGAHYDEPGRQTLAHRFAYELVKGPIPEGLHIDHTCFVKQCVRPSHLEAVTPKENTRRAQIKYRIGIAVTHCPAGHPYDDQNTRNKGTGGRVCRACARAYAAGKRPEPQPKKTHCPQGHEYSIENTYIFRGKRRCNTCHRERERARQRARKELVTA